MGRKGGSAGDNQAHAAAQALLDLVEHQVVVEGRRLLVDSCQNFV